MTDESTGPTLPLGAPVSTIPDDDDDPRHGRPSPVRGYHEGRLLGRGGMGDVVLAHDDRVGRRVAIKRLRAQTPSPEARARFLREARIQARLEHPAIVPVYELGEDDTGAPYFTMKRLAGVTLGQRMERHELARGAAGEDVDALRATDPMGRPAGDPAKIEAGQKELLRAVVDVCLAIDFAHSHGVVHRDLKPTNIMLGNFGEVYVLDWGVARVIGRDGDAAEVELGDVATLDGEGQTQAGAVLGTPGYMAPEQVHGEAVEPPADVYAIGALLFEVLAGEPLHPRGAAALASTLLAATASPAQRRPDRAIAPELDAACRDALAALPGDRPTARALAERLQRYLDGDRDLERRRALAAEALAVARAAADSGDPARRAEAMSAANRALVLDPESRAAAALVGKLMLEPPPPEAMPAELAAKIRDAEVDHQVRTAGATIWALAAFVMFVPFLAWVRVSSWPWIAAIFAAIAGLIGLSVAMVRTRRSMLLPFLVGFALLMMMFSRLFGPFVIVPGLACIACAVAMSMPDGIERPWLPLGAALLALLGPIALEELGVLAPTWSLAGNRLVATSIAFDLDGTAAIVLVLVANIALVVVNAGYALAIARGRRAADRHMASQAWHLAKLLPPT